MLKRVKRDNLLFILLSLVTLVCFVISSYNIIYENRKKSWEKESINQFISYSGNNELESDYFLVIEIPKIGLQKGIYDIYDIRNDVDMNIALLEGSNIEDNFFVIASHSGSNIASYFDDLHLLEYSDIVNLYSRECIYQFKVSKKNIRIKEDKLVIANESLKNRLILITCMGKNKQIIYELDLAKITERGVYE